MTHGLAELHGIRGHPEIALLGLGLCAEKEPCRVAGSNGPVWTARIKSLHACRKSLLVQLAAASKLVNSLAA